MQYPNFKRIVYSVLKFLLQEWYTWNEVQANNINILNRLVRFKFLHIKTNWQVCIQVFISLVNSLTVNLQTLTELSKSSVQRSALRNDISSYFQFYHSCSSVKLTAILFTSHNITTEPSQMDKWVREGNQTYAKATNILKLFSIHDGPPLAQ